ncbi:hypothetical protein [Pseudanabaena sp. Chao 1811]|uniref:hypothetical protein n=1 Tax=Pseudanabaena sp. Chao 1811 TaxID=2963092 RepID=UPI0022F3B240|nr:hypothetical protein [Pseudanabaena sp. Chao 1811]
MSNMFSALGDIFQQIADHTGDVRQRQQKMAKVEQAQKRIFTLMDLNRYEEAIKCIEDLMVEIPEVASSGRAWAFRAFFWFNVVSLKKPLKALTKLSN